MYCTECAFNVSAKRAPNLDHCNICNIKLTPTMEDIFKHKKYNLVNEVRNTQVELATDINNFITTTKKGVFMAQGGTGIGKTFAYLVPSILQGKRIIISTAKKTLQTQLITKDLPYVINKLSLGTTYTIYKGKANYACWKLTNKVPSKDKKKYIQFIENAKNKKQPADLDDWEGLKPIWWDTINIDKCPLGQMCKYFKKCRPMPKDYQVVVTNHHLTGIDIKLTPGTLFGQYSTIIFDEAQHFPDAARSVFERKVSNNLIKRIAKQIKNNDLLHSYINLHTKINIQDILRHVKKLEETFSTLYNKALKNKSPSSIVSNKALKDESFEFSKTATIIGQYINILHTEVSHYYDKIEKKQTQVDLEFGVEESIILLATILALKDNVSSVIRFTKTICTCAKTSVFTKEENNGYKYNIIQENDYLKATPRNIGNTLRPKLDLISHKILVSATLALGSDFTFSETQWGFNHDKVKKYKNIYTSPFNYAKQAKLYLPIHLPMYEAKLNTEKRRIWINELATEIAQLIGAINGNTLVLFASNQDLNDFEDELKDDITHPLYVQRDNPQQELQKYINTPNSVLFGLKSFWEGIDLPGEKLKLVIIPRLPFPNPLDPIIATMQSTVKNGFKDISVPLMIFEMKQGIGRLIRTKTDTGIIAILDVRAWTGTSNRGTHNAKIKLIKRSPTMPRMGYGKQLLDELGLSNFHYNFTEINKFIKRIHKNKVK